MYCLEEYVKERNVQFPSLGGLGFIPVSLITPGHPKIPQDTTGHSRIPQDTYIFVSLH